MNIAQLLWQCRRGMLELDLLLIPFVENHYPTLTNTQQQTFQDLLHYPDPVIYAWIMGHETAEPEFIHLVQSIRSAYQLPPV